nr:uncharacterized protein LOC109162486 [Ipomoea batatas]
MALGRNWLCMAAGLNGIMVNPIGPVEAMTEWPLWKKFFMQYMKKKCHESRSKRLKTINLGGLRIDWRDPNNKEDCGVFVMRHMESYLGGGLRNWDCGLDRQNKSQLDRLRLKYVAAILNAENNELRDENISMALEFVKKF